MTFLKKQMEPIQIVLPEEEEENDEHKSKRRRGGKHERMREDTDPVIREINLQNDDAEYLCHELREMASNEDLLQLGENVLELFERTPELRDRNDTEIFRVRQEIRNLRDAMRPPREHDERLFVRNMLLEQLVLAARENLCNAISFLLFDGKNRYLVDREESRKFLRHRMPRPIMQSIFPTLGKTPVPLLMRKEYSRQLTQPPSYLLTEAARRCFNLLTTLCYAYSRAFVRDAFIVVYDPWVPLHEYIAKYPRDVSVFRINSHLLTGSFEDIELYSVPLKNWRKTLRIHYGMRKFRTLPYQTYREELMKMLVERPWYFFEMGVDIDRVRDDQDLDWPPFTDPFDDEFSTEPRGMPHLIEADDGQLTLAHATTRLRKEALDIHHLRRSDVIDIRRLWIYDSDVAEEMHRMAILSPDYLLRGSFDFDKDMHPYLTHNPYIYNIHVRARAHRSFDLLVEQSFLRDFGSKVSAEIVLHEEGAQPVEW